MGKPKTIRPSYYDEDDSNYNDAHRKQDNDSDDEISNISFSTLNSAQLKLKQQEMKEANEKRIDKNSNARDRNLRLQKIEKEKYQQEKFKSDEQYEQSESDSDSDSDGEFFESGSRNDSRPGQKKKRSKHAPAESSTKRPVSKIRSIPGLEDKKHTSLYTDIRFDPAYGKADLARIRKDYKFLDDYRTDEIKNMESVLRTDKRKGLLNEYEKIQLKFEMQSLKSRVDTMKNRDLEEEILKDFKRKQKESFKNGEQTNQYFLKRSDKRKLIQKAKFDSMKSSQVEKVMERKRKRRLGKEFKELEFNQRS